jgi:hypothetical protein
LAAWLVAVAVLAGASADDRPGTQELVTHHLPWHAAVVDAEGKLLAWYRPHRNLGYDHVLRLGWGFIGHGVPRDRRTGLKAYLVYSVFDGQSLRGMYWQHKPAALYASFVDSLVAWYPYSGDRNAIDVVREMLDYQLAHGTTPSHWEWARVPFATSCAGLREYGACLAGAPRTFYGGLEPDKVGLLGLGYLRFYQLTEERRFLDAAIAAADALARHVRTGSAEQTPWPFRVDGKTGEVLGGAEFGGMIVAPVRLLGELAHLGVGDVTAYARARTIAWDWVVRHPLEPRSAAWNRWSGYYEDVTYNPESLNQILPMMTAHHLLTQDGGAAADPLSLERSRALVEWVRTTFGRGPFFGAWGIDEQLAPGRRGCCSPAGSAGTTSRWAAVNALLYARTGDPGTREAAFRSLNYATYFARSDGRIACCGLRPLNNYWFSAGYADYLRSFNWAMAAIPELAPMREDHLLGSTSVVQAVAYRPRAVRYRTFDPRAVEVLRLTFEPARVLADGRPLGRRDDLAHEGYVVQALAGGDAIVRIRHDSARRISVEGRSLRRRTPAS